jgi:hypothetical protein
VTYAARVLERLRGVVPREPVDDAFDWVRSRIDSPRSLAYQPLAAASDAGGVRAGGTQSRWRAIAPVTEELGVGTAVDIGCNLGWFSIQLGLAGIPTVGVEGHPPAYRTAIYSARKAGASNVSILAMHVTAENVSLVPHADATLVLAVWHHIVRRQGQPAADTVLATLWRQTRKVLFFETGETGEMPDYYRLPVMEPDPRTWVTRHLAATCTGGNVRHLGLHESSPTWSRSLFAVVREG